MISLFFSSANFADEGLQNEKSEAKDEISFCTIGASFFSAGGRAEVILNAMFQAAGYKVTKVEAQRGNGLGFFKLKCFREDKLDKLKPSWRDEKNRKIAEKDTMGTISTVKSHAWDYVIFQENSITPFEDETGEYIDSFFSEMKKVADPGTKFIDSMTWVKQKGKQDYQTIIQYHLKAMERNGFAIAPTAAAFEIVENERPDIRIFRNNPDDRHPYLAGQYLQCCVIFAAITGKNPAKSGLPTKIPDAKDDKDGQSLDIPADVAEYLQETAWRVVQAYSGAKSGAKVEIPVGKATNDKLLAPVISKIVERLDSHGRLLERREYSPAEKLQSVTEFQYDKDGNPSEEIAKDASGTVKSRKLFKWISNGKLSQEIVASSEGTPLYASVFKYDSKGFLTEYRQSDAKDVQIERYEYENDGNGRALVAKVHTAAGQHSHSIAYEYDGKGLTKETKNLSPSGKAIGGRTAYRHDGAGRLVLKELLDEEGNPVHRLEISYDPDGLVVKEVESQAVADGSLKPIKIKDYIREQGDGR